MFSNLLFLIFVMLIISLTPIGEQAGNETYWTYSLQEAWAHSILAYSLILLLIWLQGRWASKRGRRERMLILVNLELLGFLFYSHFILGGPRIFEHLPLIDFSQTLMTLFSLFLYFGGLTFFHYMASKRSHSSTPFSKALLETRFLAPFTLPFLFLTFLLDLLYHIPEGFYQDLQLDNVMLTIVLVGITLIILAIVMMLFPFALQKIWQCQPLQDSPLRKRLEALCQKAHFKHAGLLTWTVLNHSLTAAIIGIIPRFRYVMFTKRLLHEMPADSIEAILAHEIGHSYRKHLLIYPFIFFGISVLIGLFSMLTSQALAEMLSAATRTHPSYPWSYIQPIVILLPYAVIIALYFRFVFGFFSRLFERQADLHVFELSIPPEHLTHALEAIGTATGNSHHYPNWHHYSIQQRIDFLNAAKQDPTLIRKHHNKVKWSLCMYLALLICGLILLFR